MTMEIFLTLLVGCSIITTITVEGIKQMFTKGEARKSNIIAAIVAIVLALAFSIGYAILASIAFTIQYIVAMIALCFLSWLCAMIGYDKVAQAIMQIKNAKNGAK